MKMRRLKLVALVMTLAMVISTASAFACTGAYVGKDVSEDGTTIIARSEDQGTGAYAKMFKVQPRVTKAGRYYVDEGEDQKGFKVPLPKTTYKYTYVPDVSTHGDGEYPASCTNEYGLAVVGTVSASPSEAYEAADPFKETGTGLREAILPGLIACQAKTARVLSTSWLHCWTNMALKRAIFCSLPIRRKHGSLKFTVVRLMRL